MAAAIGYSYVAGATLKVPKAPGIENKIKGAVFILAAILLVPFCQCDAYYERIFTIDTLYPDDSKCINLARQFFLLVGALGWGALGLLTTLPAIALRGIAVYLQSSPYIFAKGENSPYSRPEKQAVSLLSWSVYCGSGGDPIYNRGVAPTSFRLERIAAKLIRQKADVNCLHEVFDVMAAEYLKNKLEKAGYNYFYYNIDSSGIFVASRFEIIDPEFTSFTNGKNQGVFGFTIVEPKGPLARIHAIHLTESKKPDHPKFKEQKCRQEQLKQVADIIKKKADDTLPVLIAGVFNMGSKELNALSFSDEYGRGTATFFKKTWSGNRWWAYMNEQKASRPKNLHHIFAKNTEPMTIIPFSNCFKDDTYREKGLSNCEPLYTTF